VLSQSVSKAASEMSIYAGTHLEIINRKKEAKSRTLQVRKDYNRVVREQGNDL
jgi:hypothetical protein